MFTLLLLLRGGDIEPHPGPRHDLRICHINARSLCPNDRSKRIAEIHSMLCIEENYDIICISETWLTSDNDNESINIPNYQIYRKDRAQGRGGGVAIYVNENLPVKRRPDLEDPDLEFVLLELLSQGKRFLVGACYRPPGSTAREAQIFIDRMENTFNNIITDAPECFFLLGDFNDICILWDDNHNESELGTKLRDLINGNNLFQLIQEPTHVTLQNQSLLDIIITDSPGYTINSGVGPPLGDPYHCLIFCTVRIQKNKTLCYPRNIWMYKLGDYDSLDKSLKAAPWGTMDIFDDINDASNYFSELFLNTCREFIPTKNITVRPREEPWVTNEVRRNLRKRNRAHKRWKRNTSQENFDLYTDARNNAELSKVQAKEAYYTNLSMRLTNPNTNLKEYWHLTKELYGSKVKGGIPSLIKDGIVYANAQDKCNIFNEHFARKAKLPDQLPPLPEPVIETDATIDTLQFTEEEVKKVIKNLDVTKATGPDGVSNTLLKRTADSIKRPLCSLFNRSLSCGIFPADWKLANLSPIFKANDKQDPSNYRPISLLSNIGKMLERLVFIKLYEYCKSNGLLTWRNAAYKAGDSTVNQLVYLVHRIYEALERGEDICFVSLDASAAFDRVWHAGLIHKLKCFGIQGTLLLWLSDYLSNRKQRVVIDGQHSEWTYIKSGVPQGSILGPLLFLIYTNDIVNNIESEILLFADDTAILEPLSNGNQSIDKLNRDLQTLGNWAAQWLVQFNPTKTKYLIFSKKIERLVYPPLYLQNKQLVEVASHKHLGLTLNNKLTWDDHITRICTDAGKRLSVIKRLPSNITPYTKLQLYKTFVRPVLEYGSVIFDNCTKNLSDAIESVQRQAAIASTRAYRKTPTPNLLNECGLDSLQDRRCRAKLVLMFKMKKGKTPDYLRTLLPGEVGENQGYNLRNSQDIRMPKVNKNYFLKSFIPSTIKSWNKLNENIRSISEVDTFRLNLKTIFGKIETYKPYLTGHSEGSINLARIRMNLSGLNAHRKKHHFIDYSSCPNCNNPLEDDSHYFFECTAYTAHRQELMEHLGGLLPGHGALLGRLETRSNRVKLTKIITKGTKSENKDIELFEIVSLYIERSERFVKH